MTTAETEKIEVILRCGIKKEQGYLYFLDKNGDGARIKQRICGTKRNNESASK
jgi:hypothetical protein